MDQAMSNLKYMIDEAFASTSRKASKYDSYLTSYAEIIGPLLIERRNTSTPLKLLEIGVQDGGSLQAWKALLGKNSDVIGIDINPECANLASDDIYIYTGDQGDPSVWSRVISEHGPLDIIIDDGSHIGYSQAKTIDYALGGAIGDSGILIIEDIHTAYIDQFHGDGVGINILDKAANIIARMNSRSCRLNAERKSKLLHIEQSDVARRSIESVRFYESIIAFYIKRNIPDSKEFTTGRGTCNSILDDLRGDSRIFA